MVKEKVKPVELQKEETGTEKSLVLFNDDVNSFDFVIDSLIEVCGHEPEQAEQCTMIAHFKGKCNVKSGDFYILKPLFEELTLRGLTVTIE
jgi:ATP-dependent Clp protease adaptor protein ClpS